MRSDALLIFLASLPFLGALLLSLTPNNRPRQVAWTAGLIAILGCALLALAAQNIFAGEVLRWSIEWLPALDLRMGFRMDGLAFMFALLVLGIGALVVLYAAYYLDPKDPPARFFSFLLLFMGAMLGVVLSDNLVLLVVFWELTSLSSFLLIGFWHADPLKGQQARQGARMAFTITGTGGLCLLAGVLLIGQMVGSTDLEVVLASSAIIQTHPLYEVALVLVLLGAFTKSAQFPFHFWLPHAMAAPTPVSAYLHSATMVKAGVFLIARLYPALGGSEPWFWIVSLTGLATLILGAYMALFKHDLKGLLAYSTISHLGLITLLFGLDTPMAVVAGVFHIINHATFKASLFMAAGIIDHETGSRDMRHLNGLWRFMPVTGALAMVASAAMAGVPLLNGFLSKEMFFAEAVSIEGHAPMQWLLPITATVAAAFSVAYSLRFIHAVFFNGEPVGLQRIPHEPPRFMRMPVELLVLLCLAVGLMPQWIIGSLLAVASQASLFGPNPGSMPQYQLALWHGWNLPLLMSVAALALGSALYFALHKRVNIHTLDRVPATPRREGKDLFMSSLRRGLALAVRTTGQLQTGELQRYLIVLVLFAVLAGAWPFVEGAWRGYAQLGPSVTPPEVDGAFGAVWLIGIVATLAATLAHRQRLMALIMLGIAGLVVSLTFVYFSAPDLALTQLLVEVATIVLMMLALHWLPQQQGGGQSDPADSTWRRGRDAVVAIAAGAGIAALAYMVLGRPLESISPFYLANTISQGGGANAVNVIIVDFRGFDTLGEITVMVIAGIVVHALLNGFRPEPPLGQTVRLSADRPPLMLVVIGRWLLPLATMVSIYLYMRGHNLPGGGFIAGLLLAIALLLQFLGNGQEVANRQLNMSFAPWMGWGLLIAGGSGLASWYFGAPFLTTTYDYPMWPIVGAVPLASAAVFDLGVFLCVTGATMVALLSLAKLSAHSPQAGEFKK